MGSVDVNHDPGETASLDDSNGLQAEAKDIVAAVEEVDSVISTLQDVRDNISTHHTSWYSIVEEMCSDICTEPSLPRRCGQHVHRSNIPTHTPSEYYCHCISFPFT